MEQEPVVVGEQEKSTVVQMKTLRKNVQKASKIKGKAPASAKKKLNYILAAMVAAIRAWWSETVANFAYKGMKHLGNLLKRIGMVFLGFFDLDSKEKIGSLVKSTKQIVRSAGNQALAASLMALLTALAGGARQAMESIISKSEASVLKNIVNGTVNETVANLSGEQSNLFGRSESVFANRGPVEPPWGHNRPSPQPAYGGGFGDSWRKP